MSTTSSKSVVGAWLLHHDQKLANASTTEFESIVVAGRSARLLSVLSRENATTVPPERVFELARGIGLRKIEVDPLLKELSRHGLIDSANQGIAVLGVSQASLLHHTADIFEAQSPIGVDRAVIELAELSSSAPLRRSDCEEQLSDTYRLSRDELDDVFTQSEHIGFVDHELDGTDRLYFNGSLFRRSDAAKTRRLLDNLNRDEAQRLAEAEALVKDKGCILAARLQVVLGQKLWAKLHQIGFFDVSEVVNERGGTKFATKPDALSKYVPNGLADILDDAKALASSLTYGIVKSDKVRGQIRDPSALIGALIDRGFVEGWASAIKKDYRILERRGVVHVTASNRGNRLTLLKEEVGLMAKDLILQGDASATAAEVVVGNSASSFYGPEVSRTTARRVAVPESKSGVMRALNVLRKGKQ